MFKFILITSFAFSLAAEDYRLKIINSKNVELTTSLQKKLVDIWNSISNNDKKSYINFDDNLDTIWLYGKGQDLREFRKVFKKLDKKPAQVRIDFVILRANDTITQIFGLDWSGTYNRISKIKNFNFVGIGSGSLTNFPDPIDISLQTANIRTFLPNLYPPVKQQTLNASDITFAFPVFFNGPNINIENLIPSLGAYKQSEKIQLYSAPSIMTNEGSVSKFFIGQIFPYYVSIRDSVYDNPDQTQLSTLNVSQLNYKNIGTMIQVTPDVINRNRISLDIFIERNSIISGSNQYDFNQVLFNPPTLRTIKFNETIQIENGKCITILTSENKNDYTSITAAPKLSKLPLVGRLFKGDGEFENLEKEFIIITAKIIE